MLQLTDAGTIRSLLERHGFHFSKAMGQNFLCAGWVPSRIAECAGADRKTGVLEIGPGIGCLTAELSRRAGRVVSVELDRRLLPILAETLADCRNVKIVPGDIMALELPALMDFALSGFERRIVCANLPYQITTPVLSLLLRSGCFESLTVMLQREVAERICAKENTPEYGAFSILVQWYAVPERLFDVPPSCFLPAPKVTSSVLRLNLRKEPPVAVSDPELFFALVRAAFQQRRKTLCNAMVHGLGLKKEDAVSALESCGLSPMIRGEALSIAQFALLSEHLKAEIGAGVAGLPEQERR